MGEDVDWDSLKDSDLGEPLIRWDDIKNSDLFYPKGYEEYERERMKRYRILQKKKWRANIKKRIKSKKKRKRYYKEHGILATKVVSQEKERS